MSFRAQRANEGIAWVPVSVASVELGVSKQRVHQLIQSGRLVARQYNRTWLVNSRSIEARIALLGQEARSSYVVREGL